MGERFLTKLLIFAQPGTCGGAGPAKVLNRTWRTLEQKISDAGPGGMRIDPEPKNATKPEDNMT
jgi:hypothetical protein